MRPPDFIPGMVEGRLRALRPSECVKTSLQVAFASFETRSRLRRERPQDEVNR